MVLCDQGVNNDDDLTPFQRSMRAKLSIVFELLRVYKRPSFWSAYSYLKFVFEGADAL